MTRNYAPSDQRRIAVTFLWVFVCLLVFATCVRGAPPIIKTDAPPDVVKEVTGKVGEPIFFEVRGKSADTFMIPGYEKAKCPVVRLHSEDEYIMLYMAFPKEDGTFIVSFLTVGEKQYTQLAIRVGKGKPVPPNPEPDPQPDPDVNKADRVWVIVVEDAGAMRSLETAKALNDPFWQSIKGQHDYRFYLSNAATSVENGYTAEAEKTGVGYPAVIIVNTKDNKVLRSFKLTNVEALKSEFKKVVK